MSEDHKGVPDIAAGMSAAAAPPAVPDAPAVPATAGEILRAAREAQGVHLAVLAASLKVAPRKLELIENNRHDELSDATFARALALSMCRALKIDAEPVLSRLPQPAGQRLEQISAGLNQPFRDRDTRHDGADWGGLPSLPVLAALLLVLAALAVYLLPSLGSGSLSALLPSMSSSEPPSAASEARGAATAPVVVESVPASPAVAPVAEAAVAPASAPASALVETVFSAPPETAASAPVAGGVLSLRASAESWVEVRDAGGQTLLSRNLAPGEVAGVDGALPLRVIIGNAEATEVSFRGKPVELRPTRDNVARLELK